MNDTTNKYTTAVELFWIGPLGNYNSEQIESIKKSPQHALIYAEIQIGGRWLDAEPYIMQDAKAAQQYAWSVLDARWKAAEAVILTNAEATDDYYTHMVELHSEEKLSKDEMDEIAAKMLLANIDT